MASPARLVTPEAVVLDLQTASAGWRLLGRLIDVVLTFAGFSVISAALALAGPAGLEGTALVVLYSFAFVAAVLVYPALMEGLWDGRTLGKAVAGLRVVRTDGGPIGFRHAVVRAGFGLIEVWVTLGSVGLTAMLLSPREQRLGDMAAGTLVLRYRRARALRPVLLLVPPGYEEFVRTIDVGAMTAADYEVVRSFLVRWRDFGDRRRPAVAAKVAAPLWQRFKHPVPAGLGPDYYLACLGAAYQRHHPATPPRVTPS